MSIMGTASCMTVWAVTAPTRADKIKIKRILMPDADYYLFINFFFLKKILSMQRIRVTAGER